MPPTPKTATVMQQQNLHSRIFPSTLDDEIVVSGISGKFPSSKNIAEFESNLYNKVRNDSSNQFNNKTRATEHSMWLEENVSTVSGNVPCPDYKLFGCQAKLWSNYRERGEEFRV